MPALGYKKALNLYFSRTKNLLKIFIHNPKGIIGLFVIIIFALMAIFAPLLTPYDPVKDKYVSGSYSAPVWLKYIPSFLGGRPGAAENFAITENSDFTNSLEAWNYTTAPHISVNHSSFGIDETNPGSAKITFTRNETEDTYGNVTVTLNKEFYYPFAEKPRKFTVYCSLFANGTLYNETISKLVRERYYDNATGKWKIRTYYLNTTKIGLDVNITIFIYIQRVSDGKIFPVWPYQPQLADYLYVDASPADKFPKPGTIYNASKRWIKTDTFTPDSDIIRYPGIEDVTPIIFNQTLIPGYYRLGINITFQDFKTPLKEVEASLYVDRFYIKFEGTVWGLMGTDHYGSDLWSQLVYGSRISLYVGLLSSILSVLIGLIVGLAAGYMGRYVDEVLMRFSDMLLVLPGLPLLIVLIAVLGATAENLIIIIGLLGWMGFARLVRSQVLSLKERPFVEAARAVGAGRFHIISTHIMPNVMSLVYVSLATSVPSAIVSEAALSFLGFYDPNRMSWGRMLYEVQANGAVQYWWWVIPPGLCIAALAIAFIMFGFALDEIFNPKLRMRR